MKENPAYIGFPPLPTMEDLVHSLVNDPLDIRWRVVRQLFRIEERKDRNELAEKLQPYLDQAQNLRLEYRLTMAVQALQKPVLVKDYTILKGKGALKPDEIKALRSQSSQDTPAPRLFPVVDFHVHPKTPDLKFLSDLREAGITHAVILATDTDPSDVDRPEIRKWVEKTYESSAQAQRTPLEKMIEYIRESLYSPTHVTNRDVADWVADYPDIFIGFGSVNLSKDRDYVEEKLSEIERLKMRGIKLLPFAQFFNPIENKHMDRLFDYCRRTGSIILTHSGCAGGPFEIFEMSQNAHPDLWEPLLKKYPDVPVVLAHFGAYSTQMPGIWLYNALQLGGKYKNLYADISAVDWILDKEMVVKEIRKTIGFDRVLFGSDYPLPFSAGASPATLVSGLKANTLLTDKEKRKVLGENAAQLLGIK